MGDKKATGRQGVTGVGRGVTGGDEKQLERLVLAREEERQRVIGQ